MQVQINPIQSDEQARGLTGRLFKSDEVKRMVDSVRARPNYEALDAHGYSYTRKAQIISELPLEGRRAALDIALPKVAEVLGMSPSDRLSYGAPVHESFGLSRAEAKKHLHASLLLTMGADLSLDMIE